MDRLVTIRSNRYGLDIELDKKTDFEVLFDILSEKFKESARFFKDAKMALSFSGRVLTRTEEERILDVINRYTQIDVLCVVEQNDENEPFYRSLVEQSLSEREKRDGQFYRGSLGKRQLLESETSIIILGDVEPDARIISNGNIVVVGTLYGSAHAGASGDRNAFIVALSMQPRNLRIAEVDAKRQLIYQESINIKGPKIAVIDGNRIYLDPLVD